MGRVVVAPRALRDLDGIGDYTRRTWGERQAEKYLFQLEQRFQWLADNPSLGRSRDEIRAGLRSFSQGRHLVFYRVREDGVEIVGVPHGAMDIEAYFQDDD